MICFQRSDLPTKFFLVVGILSMFKYNRPHIYHCSQGGLSERQNFSLSPFSSTFCTKPPLCKERGVHCLRRSAWSLHFFIAGFLPLDLEIWVLGLRNSVFANVLLQVQRANCMKSAHKQSPNRPPSPPSLLTVNDSVPISMFLFQVVCLRPNLAGEEEDERGN